MMVANLRHNTLTSVGQGDGVTGRQCVHVHVWRHVMKSSRLPPRFSVEEPGYEAITMIHSDLKLKLP